MVIIIILFINICLNANIFSEELISDDGNTDHNNSILFMIDNPYASINGQFSLLDPQNIKVAPVIVNERTLIPIRFFSENFGFKVEWDSATRKSTLIKDDKIICLEPDSNVITVNGSDITLDVPSKTIQNRLYIPLRNINEIVGKKVSYNKGIILVTDSDTSIENYTDKDFADLYSSFVRTKILYKQSIGDLPKWNVAYTLVNDILMYYKKFIPKMNLYLFPDKKLIPEEAYYHSGLAVYLNLLTVENGDFDPFKVLSSEELNLALTKFEEILINEPNLNLVNTNKTPKDLLKTINNMVKDETDLIRISVYDFATDTSVNYNGQERFYAASLTKVVNLLCLLEEANNGNIDLESKYTLRKSDKYIGETKVTGTGNLRYERNGTKYTYMDILSRMISLSDNIGANIIFDKLGRTKFDSFCQRYELKDMKIYKKFYDINTAVPSNYTSVADLTKLLVLLEDRIIANDSLSTLGIEFMKNTDNKDRIPLYAPKDVTIANKIGTLTRLAGDMALVYFPEREPIALTIVVEDENHDQISESKVNKLIAQLSKQIINHYRLYSNPSLYIDGNLMQEITGLRFINNRPYIKWHDSFEWYSPEGVFIGSEKYISLDLFAKDNNYTYILENYPSPSIMMTKK